MPPSAWISEPYRKEESSEARKSATLAIEFDPHGAVEGGLVGLGQGCGLTDARVGEQDIDTPEALPDAVAEGLQAAQVGDIPDKADAP
jgi:hypothetical protein